MADGRAVALDAFSEALVLPEHIALANRLADVAASVTRPIFRCDLRGNVSLSTQFAWRRGCGTGKERSIV
jgi:hypothetical protein